MTTVLVWCSGNGVIVSLTIQNYFCPINCDTRVCHQLCNKDDDCGQFHADINIT